MASGSDILIIGGGPAGAIAAKLLADAGKYVQLIEASRFPRDKVCGECVSALGVATLKAVGLGEILSSLHPTVLSATVLHADDGRSVRLPLPHPMAGVTRSAMDTALLAAAEHAGVAVRQGVRATQITLGERPVVKVVTSESRTSLQADLVILADGKGTLPGGTNTALPQRTVDIGIKAHFAAVDLPSDAIHLFGLRGHYVGLAAVSDGDGKSVWNLASSVPSARLKASQGDINVVFAEMCTENTSLSRVMQEATRIGRWHAGPLPRFGPIPCDAWPEHVIPVGNAAAALEPIGGEGMGLAMASARLAAEAILQESPLKALDRAYRRLWQTRRFACRTTAIMLSRPRIARSTIRLSQVLPPLAKSVMRLAGKRDNSTARFATPPPALS